MFLACQYGVSVRRVSTQMTRLGRVMIGSRREKCAMFRWFTSGIHDVTRSVTVRCHSIEGRARVVKQVVICRVQLDCCQNVPHGARR